MIVVTKTSRHKTQVIMAGGSHIEDLLLPNFYKIYRYTNLYRRNSDVLLDCFILDKKKMRERSFVVALVERQLLKVALNSNVSIDRPFIVLTETKLSKRHIPVWARYSPLRTRVEAHANTLSP